MDIRTEQEVERFLAEFFPKFNVFGVFFLNRDKNEEALRALGITPVAREEIIRTIAKDDYVHTILDPERFGELWVFGKDYDGNELYIKIAMGRTNRQTICISFHVAEHPLTYPYR